MYQPKCLSRSGFVAVRHLQYHVRQWGKAQQGLAPLVLLHGWMDVAASWQFMVDALSQDRWILAPDWRGFGQTRVRDPAPDCHWSADYLADLDGLLDHFSPDQPVDLVGHSMGGNVAMIYAGVRPQRIRRLMNLEGFGLPETRPAQAPARYARWLDEIKALHRGEMDLKCYDSLEAVAQRLRRTNPRLPPDKAMWLAQHWATRNAQGLWQVLGDPAHKVVGAHLYQVEEALAVYRCISAPVLSVTASEDSLAQLWRGQFTAQQHQERLRAVPNLQQAVVQDAAHMLHHDQPEALARCLEDFFA